MATNSNQPSRQIPLGTQVVTTQEIYKSNGDVAFMRGAVGLIVHQPVHDDEPYRVRFVDGTESKLMRAQLAIRSHFTDPRENDSAIDSTGDSYDLKDFIILRCIIGSRAYGLDHDTSDTDWRGIYLPPASLHWSLYGVPEQLENEAEQSCYWELQKFIVLALKANPNILECLYTPLIVESRPPAKELLAMRQEFLSKLLYQTYNGYVISQFRRLQRHHQTKGTINWKHAMHLIRLLLAGITALNEGYVPVDVGHHRDALMTIRHGEMAWESVDAWRLRLHSEFEVAFAATTLPERPNYEAANRLLVQARRMRVVE